MAVIPFTIEIRGVVTSERSPSTEGTVWGEWDGDWEDQAGPWDGDPVWTTPSLGVFVAPTGSPAFDLTLNPGHAARTFAAPVARRLFSTAGSPAFEVEIL